MHWSKPVNHSNLPRSADTLHDCAAEPVAVCLKPALFPTIPRPQNIARLRVCIVDV